MASEPTGATELRLRAAVESSPSGLLMTDARGRRQILGRWVRVTGWLMFDAEHANAATNTAPGHPHDWRATAWEVHPITELLVVPRPR